MDKSLQRKFLGIPRIIWVLQLSYVAAVWVLFAVLALFTDQVHHLSFQLGYVLVMVIVNIIWRTYVMKRKPEWFSSNK